jgi:WXG100 family type VII secretion target
MDVKTIQADYEQLETIATRFAQLAEENDASRINIVKGLAALRQGGWEGEGAHAFFAEMDGNVLPATERLSAVLEEAQKVTVEIVRLMQEAEEEAARPFQGDYAGGSSGGKKGDDGKLVGDGAVHDRPSKDLAVNDPKNIFSEDYMENMIGSHHQGENSQALNTTMESALQQMRETGQIDEDTLNKLADLRGVDRVVFRQQYEKFANLWRNSPDKGDINLNLHGDFMGSTVSLRYGRVVGDVFGIDPVFGSILNPTGGLVGPGSHAYWPDENDAIGYHGVFHDAAGYLYNNHQELGPGYNYLGREPFVDTGNPLSGQVSGIAWWSSHAQLNVDIPGHVLPNIVDAPDFLKPALPILGELGEDVLNYVRPTTYAVEGGMDIIDGVGDIFEGQFSEGAGDIMDGVGTIGGGIIRSGAESILGRDSINSVVDLSSRLFGYP